MGNDAVESDVDRFPLPLCLDIGIVLELGIYVHGGYGIESTGGVVWSILVARRVVDRDFLDLRGRQTRAQIDSGGLRTCELA